MAGFALLVAAELTDPFNPGTAETLFSISPLVIGIGMVVTGAAVLRAQRWTGWRRSELRRAGTCGRDGGVDDERGPKLDRSPAPPAESDPGVRPTYKTAVQRT